MRNSNYDNIVKQIQLPTIIDNNYIINRNNNSESHLLEYSFSLCGQDVSQIEMSHLSKENFLKLSFDENTKFSLEQIEKFNPRKILEESKEFGISLNKLHKAGIDGTGVKVAIIDTEFDTNNTEFCDINDNNRVTYNNTYLSNVKDIDRFHGKAVTSLLAGKECGIAPNVQINYFAISDRYEDTDVIEILEYIKANNMDIDVVSMSSYIKNPNKAKEILSMLKDNKCEFIDSGTFWKNFSYGEKKNEDIILDSELQSYLSDIDKLSSNQQQIIKNLPNSILIPNSGRTHLQMGNNCYMYSGVGSASWSIPEVSGLFALARQMDPLIDYEEFVQISTKTATINGDGYKVINPEGIIREIDRTNMEKRNENPSQYDSIYKKSSQLISDLDKQYIEPNKFLSELKSNVNNDSNSYTKKDNIQLVELDTKEIRSDIY